MVSTQITHEWHYLGLIMSIKEERLVITLSQEERGRFQKIIAWRSGTPEEVFQAEVLLYADIQGKSLNYADIGSFPGVPHSGR